MSLLLTAGAARAQFRVVGYLPAWRGALMPAQLRQVTHVNYAFVQLTAAGGLEAVPSPAKLRQLVAAAHAAKVRVLVSVGGWHDGDHSAFDAIGASPALTNIFTASLSKLADEYQLDGIDIDWEHPDSTTAASYAALMHALAARLHPRGRLLTTAIAGTAWAGRAVLPSVLTDVDFLNIMAYDNKPPAHATYAAAVEALAYWQKRGLPFYGQPSQESFAALLARGANPAADSLGEVGYNGLATIRRKTELALNQASGVMIWELTQDAAGPNSLLAAIAQVVARRAAR